MSTEEVQVSRKRAASEEVEVTIKFKAKKSKVPVAVTITFNNDREKNPQPKPYEFDVEALDPTPSKIVGTPQWMRFQSPLAPSTAPSSPDEAENDARKEKKKPGLGGWTVAQSAGPFVYATGDDSWDDYLNLLKGVHGANEYGMRFDPDVLAGFVKILGDDLVRRRRIRCDDQNDVVDAILERSERISTPELWEVDLLRSLVKKLNDKFLVEMGIQ